MEVPIRPEPAPPKRPRVYLVDGSGYIFRAYHALPPLTRKKDGMPTGAVYGFTNMLAKLLADIGDAGHVAVLFDAGRDTFRTTLYPEYKAHRPPVPEDLVPQFAAIREATRAFNLPCLERQGLEADDLIASYAKQAQEHGYDVVIVSSDKDLMQLIRPGVRLHDPIKDRPIGEAEVVEKFGVVPGKLVELLALMGDASDNVPGVPGIGPKTAAELLATYGDLDTLLARADEIKQPKRREALIANAAKARISRDLVKLRDDVPLDMGLDALTLRRPDPAVLFAFLEQMEFGNILTRLRSRFGSDHTGTVPVLHGEPAAPTLAPPRAAAAPAADFAAILSLPDLVARVAAARAAGVVALHIEGSAADEMQAEIVGIACSYREGEGWYVPTVAAAQGSLAVTGTAPLLPLPVVLDALRGLLADRSVLKIGHDAKYALKLLARHGLTVAPIDDTMLLSFVIGGGRDDHGLDGIAERLLGAKPIARTAVTGTGRTAVAMTEVAPERAATYAGARAEAVLRVQRALRHELFGQRLVTVYETTERPLVPVLLAMERNGIKVDPLALAGLSEDFGRRMADLERDIHRLAGREFNVGSPKQLGEVLFDEMKLAGGRRTKTGAWSTDSDILDVLVEEGQPLPEKVLAWREVAKLKSTYTDTLGAQINPATGRIHTSYQMAGAATGRLASIDPNLQNIPVRTEEGRKIRRAFVAPPGWRLVSADYSQIELRLLAHVAGIDSLKQAFKDGIDIHALTASQVFGVPIEGMDPATRRSAKAINFGIIYGISAFGLSRQLGIPRNDASRYIEAYFERYPGIRAYMERAKKMARDNGFVTTLFGRRIHVPGIHDKNHAHRSFQERAAINAPLQGSAADILKRAMVRMDRALRRSTLKARMLLSVHDEILFEAPEAEVDTLRAMAKRAMEGAAYLSVPLTVETGAGLNWDEAH